MFRIPLLFYLLAFGWQQGCLPNTFIEKKKHLKHFALEQCAAFGHFGLHMSRGLLQSHHLFDRHNLESLPDTVLSAWLENEIFRRYGVVIQVRPWNVMIWHILCRCDVKPKQTNSLIWQQHCLHQHSAPIPFLDIKII
jgi:hypothetical protein